AVYLQTRACVPTVSSGAAKKLRSAREWLRAYARFHVSRAVSVTGWGHGGGRYSQLLRVGSSSLKRRLVESLLLGCGLVSRSGLCGGRPTITATGPVSVLGGLRGMLRGRGIALLLRGAVAAHLALVALREMLNPVTVDLHRRLTLIHVSAADSARDNHSVSGANAKTGDQVVVIAPESNVVEGLGE